MWMARGDLAKDGAGWNWSLCTPIYVPKRVVVSQDRTQALPESRNDS